ncbi:MAG: hypothetical protein Q4F24_13020 [Eubacteriales bacterium]|nr:hypothetical protein [Eubacteriales bacterium]
MRLIRNIRTVTRVFLIMTILLFPWTVQREVLAYPTVSDYWNSFHQPEFLQIWINWWREMPL